MSNISTMERPAPTEKAATAKDSGPKPKIGIAFQGGSFLAGAINAGVVRGLAEKQAFETYDVQAFSGTSAGALVAAVCWECALHGKLSEAPDVLEELWLHNASPIIPNQTVGDAVKLFERAAFHNPLYFLWSETVKTPLMRAAFKKWIRTYIHPEVTVPILYERYRNSKDFPHFVFGATEIRNGEIIGFRETDVIQAIDDAEKELSSKPHLSKAERHAAAIDAGVDAMFLMIQCSGSLDALNGLTRIDPDRFVGGRFKGTYLDGAWGQNPPVNDLIDYGVDEIWLVEAAFPQKKDKIPRNLEEREDRHEELLQNALVQHEREKIEKINEFLALGRLIIDPALYRESLNRIKSNPVRWKALAEAFKEKYEESYNRANERMPTTPEKIIDALVERAQAYRPVKTRVLPCPAAVKPMTAGARIVTLEAFLRDNMKEGQVMAEAFWDELAKGQKQ